MFLTLQSIKVFFVCTTVTISSKYIYQPSAMIVKSGVFLWGIYRPLRNTPLLTIIADSWYMYFELIVKVVHTRKH